MSVSNDARFLGNHHRPGCAVAKSKRLRTRDLRNLYGLLGECCELGADPIAWRQHLVGQVPDLLGGQAVAAFEAVVVARPFQDPFWLRPLWMADFGWSTPSDRKPFESHVAGGRPEEGPHITPDLLIRCLKTVQWHEMPCDGPWHETRFYNEYVKPANLDDGLLAHQLMEPGRVAWLLVTRAASDRSYHARDKRLMRLLNLELARLLGTRLARLSGPTVTDLSPRQRDVLICLMEGDSEKEVALRLCISRHTVHDYIKMLYGQFEVHSRGELLSRCRAFWPVLKQGPQGTNNATFQIAKDLSSY